MKNVTIISVSLPREDVERLDRLAKEAGSRSSAVRELIRQDRKAERLAEMEEQYRAYYSIPGAYEADRKLTEEMQSIASWPDDYPRLGGKHARKKHPPG